MVRFPFGPVHVHVTQRGIRGPDSLLGLFEHAFAGFFREVVDIVLSHQDLDAMHELLGRTGVSGECDVFLDEVDLDTEIFDCDPILKIAVKPVRFFDQDDPRTRSTAQKRDHLAEASSTAPLRRLHVSEFLGDADRVFGGVMSEQFLLRWN